MLIEQLYCFLRTSQRHVSNSATSVSCGVDLQKMSKEMMRLLPPPRRPSVKWKWLSEYAEQPRRQTILFPARTPLSRSSPPFPYTYSRLLLDRMVMRPFGFLPSFRFLWMFSAFWRQKKRRRREHALPNANFSFPLSCLEQFEKAAARLPFFERARRHR